MTTVDLKDNLTIQDELHVCILVFPLSSLHTQTFLFLDLSSSLLSDLGIYLRNKDTRRAYVCVCVISFYQSGGLF